jgi:Tol biopolymer transport system component/tRNA A-37 threonylcarbamoyl transferase component Bud32
VAQWTAEQWERISAHLDHALELEGRAREGWITELERQDAELGRQLRELLEAHAANSAAAFLERSPLSGPAGAQPEADATDYRSQMIGRQFGSYRVLSLLGHGGMGSVWLAERVDGLFTRRVALKLIHPALVSQMMTERFSREREILASLDHPNITRLIDAGFAADDQPYLALEYVDGTPITAYCDERRLSIRERLELLRQVLSAVQYAHAHLVIHRDLKPSNILVTQDGQAHLLDFGIAKLLTEGEAKETELTRLGGRALTPDYAAPEQIAGAPITIAADVYALGVMLYELLIGERPYRLKRDSRGALEEAILQVEATSPSRILTRESAALARATTARKLTSELKGDLDTIVIKALKKLPTERYQTVNALGEDIDRYLRGDVVLAQRDSVAYRALKFARRYRVAISVVSIVILALAVGLAATTYEAQLAATQRDAALQAQRRSLTQTAAARLKEGDVSSALGIILEVLPHPGAAVPAYTSEALSVFHEAGATDAAVLAITGHTGPVRFTAFSPDGRQIVTASYDKSARIWDAATGRQVRLLSGHTDRVLSAAFSPDGRQVVTASTDKSARIWDAATGREVLLLSGHTERVLCAAFSPDGRQIVTASTDKSARTWDAATGRQVLLLSGHTDQVTFAAFSPDGRQLVTASTDKSARIWDAATGRQVLLLRGHTDQVTFAAFSADGRQVVTASGDKTARIWDTVTGRQLQLLSGHTDWVASAAFSPDGRQIVTASPDKTARIWDAATGRQVLLLSGHTDQLHSAAFSPDGKQIVTASNDKTARIWDARVPTLETQIEWAQVAQFDPLPNADRFQLGLPAAADVRRWPADRSQCDESAAAPYDPDRRASGVVLESIVTDIAVEACANIDNHSGSEARVLYQRGRAFMANGNPSAARADFEAAAARGYRVARVDLGLLLSRRSGGMLDVRRAISLYEQAWSDGVAIAAFELGSFYEHGVKGADGANDELASDETRAWRWYQKAADAREPKALARFAERADNAAFAEQITARRNAYWLESFKYYATAAERARREDWPNDAWRDWRYRRATLARLLAREGMMQEVAAAYDDVRRAYASSPPAWWERVRSQW